MRKKSLIGECTNIEIKLNDSKPKLAKLSVSLTQQTNYPDPCTVCKLHQCQMDIPHNIAYTVSDSVCKAMEEAFEKARPGLEEAMKLKVDFLPPDWKPGSVVEPPHTKGHKKHLDPHCLTSKCT